MIAMLRPQAFKSAGLPWPDLGPGPFRSLPSDPLPLRHPELIQLFPAAGLSSGTFIRRGSTSASLPLVLGVVSSKNVMLSENKLDLYY